jgi:hypothetical protein
MTIPRTRTARRVVVVLALGGAGGACAYDWTVNEAPITNEADGAAPDATVDASTATDGATVDAGPDAPRTPDAGRDAGDAAKPPECDTLAAELVNERGPAKACTLGSSGECATPITDECGCKCFLGTAGSGPANEYTATVAAYEEAGCPKPGWCIDCLAGATGTCLEVDGGSAEECVP